MVRPNENSRHADASFVEASFSTAERRGGAGAGFDVAFRAIVRAVPEHGVAGNAERGELLAEPSYLIVKRREAAVIMLAVESVRMLRIEFAVRFVRQHGGMRSVKPDDGEEGLLAGVRPANEVEGAFHDEVRVVAAELMVRHALVGSDPVGRAVEAAFGDVSFGFAGDLGRVLHGVEGRHFRFGGETFVEAVFPRRRIVIGALFCAASVGVPHGFCQGAEVPFSKVPGGVACSFQRLGESDFFGFKMADVGGVDAVTVGMSSGEAAASSGATNWGGGVPAIEPKPFSRHFIKVRRADKGMSLVACVAPSVVVGHAEDDVGLFGGRLAVLGVASSDWKRDQQSGEGNCEEGKMCVC